MELVHNWRPEPSGPFYDLTLDAAQALQFFPNVWELHDLNFSVPDEPPDSLLGHLMDRAEQRIYGLPPFSSSSAWPGFEEALERPVYVALNMYKVDMGNPGFGNISTVFSRRLAREMVMVSAFDTGMLTVLCDPDVRPHCTKILGPEKCKQLEKTISCRAWPGVLGTLQHADHLLLAQLHGYLEAPAAFVARLLARVLEGSVQVTTAEQELYWEANIFGGILYPEAVQFHVASFAELFGTYHGERLRAWCIRHGWPLIWSTSRALDADEPHSFNERVLDPQVLLHTPYGKNLTDSTPFHEALRSFRQSWEVPGKWEPFLQAQPLSLRVQPLRAGACHEPDACVGVNLEGSCVCRELLTELWV